MDKASRFQESAKLRFRGPGIAADASPHPAQPAAAFALHIGYTNRTKELGVRTPPRRRSRQSFRRPQRACAGPASTTGSAGATL